jgi:Arylsulfotransferase (ASST)
VSRYAFALLAAAFASLASGALPAAPAWAAAPVTISPLPGTPDASPRSQISFLGAPASELRDVSVVGSRSGRHRGRMESYATAPGASFLPAVGFTPGERVTASAVVGAGGDARVSSTFTVAVPSGFRAQSGKGSYLTRPGLVQSFASAPDLHPPALFVTADSPSATRGDIFFTPTAGYGQAGAMIVNERGQLVWFQPAPAGDDATDLQVETYRGRPALVWWQGKVPSELGVGFGEDEIYNSSYEHVASVRAGNGAQADLHEFQLTPQGSAFITAYSLVDADLAPYGGARAGTLQDAALQEIDVPTGLVMFEWHAYGHVALSDSYSPASTDGKPWDFFHINSISFDPWGDGNFIVSSRNTWAAYEIDHRTGAVLWRLGGKHASLRMGAGTGFAWQHDVRWQSDGTLTIFDDGATPKAHSQSRAIRERIDWATRSVSLVGRYVHGPALLAGSQGNEQLLGDGDSFVGWGELPYMTEYGANGEVLFDAHFPAPGQSYRAFRFPWSGTPAGGDPPAAAVHASSPGEATVYASWNGATSIASWRVLAGETPATLAAVATAPDGGFETAIALQSTAADFAVQALGSEGQVLGTSPAVAR